ncbi:MAG: response regulator [Chitinivibrionales bacterium]|nr:response regulator [Chitinivibrionales bacterium]MBD3394116.1 response regulator [Chitinivibrionales bacterium]
MARETVFVVEDEEDIQELITYNLMKEGYHVRGFTNGEDALVQLRNGKSDCIILDIMLPGMDGLEMARAVRNSPGTKHVPIIMLTAKGEEADIVAGLELGADDYIVKPFSPRILVARLRAVLRRKQERPVEDQRPVKIHNIEIHPGRHEVMIDGKAVTLTSSEFKALHFLSSRPGWVFTRYQIVEAVHGVNYPVTDRSVDVLVVGLRKKLGKAGKYVETVRGIGYRFKEQ